MVKNAAERLSIGSRYNYAIENLRGLAILFVIVSHIDLLKMEHNRTLKFVNFLCTNGTDFFVFIAGYLFYYLEADRFRPLNYLQKKIRFVVVPYLFLSAISIAIGIFLGRHSIYSFTPWEYLKWSVLTGNQLNFPVWFIPMIMIFYLISPILHAVGKNRYALFLLTAIAIVFSLFSTRPFANGNPLLGFLHFSGFYVLGMSASAATPMLANTPRSVRYWVVAGGLLIFLFAAFLDSGWTYPAFFYEGLGSLNPVQLGKLGLLVALFFLFELFLNKKHATLKNLAEISFGLFFLHGFFIVFFNHINNIYINMDQPVVFFLAELLAVIVISIATIISVRKVLGPWSRYAIGC